MLLVHGRGVAMIRCKGCLRHIHEDDRSCPFCGATHRRGLGKLVTTAGAGVTAVILAACYGPPAGGWDDGGLDDTGVVDLDDDGFGADIDCNDEDPEIHPGADEICDDDIDNDCDDDVDLDDSDCQDG
ncbi:MAG: hypothetical protein H6742_03575 [Alphaproteobacteria bacterium]|nr:hypothetical protein [Alphaproteobacteria bacterium]